MALSLLFADGFDTYDSLGLLWDNGGVNTGIVFDSGLQRSGRGYCTLVSAAFGPKKILNANQTVILCTGATHPGNVVVQAEIFEISDGGGGPFVRLFYGADGSLFLTLNNGAIFLQTGPGLWHFNAYNFIALRVKFGVAGHVKCWLNGTVVIDGDHNLQSGLDHVNTVQLMTAGTATARWDDVAIWACADNDDYPYMPSIYPAVPSNDGAPIAWTPNAGVTHWTQVNAVPESLANYVASSTVGQVDQYVHAIPANQQIPPLPNAPLVLAAAHNLYSELDVAGARNISSNRAGVTGPATFPLSVTPLIYQSPYTPGLTSLAALATTFFGPEVRP